MAIPIAISSLSISFSVPIAIPIAVASSGMANGRSGRINWDALGEEAEEDAGGMNYDYEFVVMEPGSCTCTHSFLQSILLSQSIDVLNIVSLQRKKLIGAVAAGSALPEV